MNKLLDIIKYSCENVNFYKKRFFLYDLSDVSEFKKIPLLFKSDIQNNIVQETIKIMKAIFP